MSSRRFVNKHVMTRHPFHGDGKRCDWCGYTLRAAIHYKRKPKR